MMPRNKMLSALIALVLILMVAAVVATVATRGAESWGSANPSETGASGETRESVPSERDASPPEPREPSRTIVPVAVNGQDVADVEQLMMWKFRFDLEPDQYNQYLWVERWTRDAEEPRVRRLGRDAHQVLSEGTFLIKLPTESDPRLFVRLGDERYRSGEADPVPPATPWRVSVLDRERKIEFGQDINLITFTHSELGTPSGGLSNVHRGNDVTVYVKTRFMPGPYQAFQPPGRLMRENTPDAAPGADASPGAVDASDAPPQPSSPATAP